MDKLRQAERERGGGGQPLDLESKKKHYKRVMHGGYLPKKHKPPDKHARLVSRPSTAKVDPSGTRKSFILKCINQIVLFFFLTPPLVTKGTCMRLVGAGLSLDAALTVNLGHQFVNVFGHERNSMMKYVITCTEHLRSR